LPYAAVINAARILEEIRMNKVSLTAIVLAFLGGSAFAADTATKPATANATAAQCTALEKQYDAASKANIAPNKLKKAQNQRAHGADLCAQGKTSSGVKALTSALKDIGVHPAS
jgi:hypothetical protein